MGWWEARLFERCRVGEAKPIIRVPPTQYENNNPQAYNKVVPGAVKVTLAYPSLNLKQPWYLSCGAGASEFRCWWNFNFARQGQELLGLTPIYEMSVASWAGLACALEPRKPKARSVKMCDPSSQQGTFTARAANHDFGLVWPCGHLGFVLCLLCVLHFFHCYPSLEGHPRHISMWQIKHGVLGLRL